ncbi:hypothetical protein OAF34_02735 [Pirellulaceae bacterium]|nr:hypothetical protein [Pirellulaceae bacterium]
MILKTVVQLLEERLQDVYMMEAEVWGIPDVDILATTEREVEHFRLDEKSKPVIQLWLLFEKISRIMEREVPREEMEVYHEPDQYYFSLEMKELAETIDDWIFRLKAGVIASDFELAKSVIAFKKAVNVYGRYDSGTFGWEVNKEAKTCAEAMRALICGASRESSAVEDPKEPSSEESSAVEDPVMPPSEPSEEPSAVEDPESPSSGEEEDPAAKDPAAKDPAAKEPSAVEDPKEPSSEEPSKRKTKSGKKTPVYSLPRFAVIEFLKFFYDRRVGKFRWRDVASEWIKQEFKVTDGDGQSYQFPQFKDSKNEKETAKVCDRVMHHIQANWFEEQEDGEPVSRSYIREIIESNDLESEVIKREN